MSFSVGQIQSCLVRVHFEELLRGSESGAKCYPLGQNSVVAGPHKMGAEMGHNFFYPFTVLLYNNFKVFCLFRFTLVPVFF